MSRPIIYKKVLSTSKGVQDGDGTIIFQEPMLFSQGSRKYVRLVEASIPSNMVNICSNYLNNKVQVTLNETILPIITFPDGIYTTTSLQGALNSAIASYLVDVNDPGILIKTNTTLQKVYIQFVSAKFKPLVGVAISSISLNLSISNIYVVLGYTATTSLTGLNDTFPAPNYAKLDYFGNRAYIDIIGLGTLAIVNNTTSTTIGTINLATDNTTNTYTYPRYGEQPLFYELGISNMINSYTVKIYGQDGLPLYFTDGEIYLLWAISEDSK